MRVLGTADVGVTERSRVFRHICKELKNVEQSGTLNTYARKTRSSPTNRLLAKPSQPYALGLKGLMER